AADLGGGQHAEVVGRAVAAPGGGDGVVVAGALGQEVAGRGGHGHGVGGALRRGSWTGGAVGAVGGGGGQQGGRVAQVIGALQGHRLAAQRVVAALVVRPVVVAVDERRAADGRGFQHAEVVGRAVAAPGGGDGVVVAGALGQEVAGRGGHGHGVGG